MSHPLRYKPSPRKILPGKQWEDLNSKQCGGTRQANNVHLFVYITGRISALCFPPSDGYQYRTHSFVLHSCSLQRTPQRLSFLTIKSYPSDEKPTSLISWQYLNVKRWFFRGMGRQRAVNWRHLRITEAFLLQWEALVVVLLESWNRLR